MYLFKFVDKMNIPSRESIIKVINLHHLKSLPHMLMRHKMLVRVQINFFALTLNSLFSLDYLFAGTSKSEFNSVICFVL